VTQSCSYVCDRVGSKARIWQCSSALNGHCNTCVILPLENVPSVFESFMSICNRTHALIRITECMHGAKWSHSCREHASILEQKHSKLSSILNIQQRLRFMLDFEPKPFPNTAMPGAAMLLVHRLLDRLRCLLRWESSSIRKNIQQTYIPCYCGKCIVNETCTDIRRPIPRFSPHSFRSLAASQ